MGWIAAWEVVKKVFGFEPETEQRMALAQPDRWSRMLKALQVSPHALMPALSRELSRGLTEAERRIQPPKQGLFFDGLMVGKKIDALEILCSRLDAAAVSSRVMGKLPSLRDWAIGALGEGSLTREVNAEAVAWARESGRLVAGSLREALLAEAIEGGRSELAKRELSDAGLERLGADEMDRYMESFAQRKAGGLSKGLDAAALEAFAASMGGWSAMSEAAAGLGFDKLMDLVANVLAAISEEELVETKILERAKTKSSKRARDLIARAMASQAAKTDRPIALRALIKAQADAVGASVERVAGLRVEGGRVTVGKMDVALSLKGGATLYEIAKLSGAAGAASMIESMAPSNSKIAPERMSELVGDVERGVRFLAMRGGVETRESTKAWRETAKAWRQGVLGEVSLKGMQKLVAQKIEADKQEGPARAAGGPKAF